MPLTNNIPPNREWIKHMSARIYALEGSWLGKPYQKNILPILERANIFRIKECCIPVTALHNALYWTGLDDEIDEIGMVVLDYRLWYYDDQTFHRYIQSIAARKFRAVCIFENPYGWERPRNIDLYSFEKKLSQRTEMICKLLRVKSPQTRIISPAIRVLEGSLQKKYLSYLLHHRNLFDAYAVHCCTETTAHSLGALASFLHQVVKVLPKPVWVTRWSVPACDHKITSPTLMEPTKWEQITSIEASLKLKTMYNTLGDISKDDICWFFVGTGQDIYNPHSSPPDLWNVNRVYLSNEVSSVWLPEHFIGTITYEGEIKQPVLNSFLEVAIENQTTV